MRNEVISEKEEGGKNVSREKKRVIVKSEK
jgi:hypothetical protein